MEKAAFLDLDYTLYNGYLVIDWLRLLRGEKLVTYTVADMAKGLRLYFLLKKHKYLEAASRLASLLAGLLQGRDVSKVEEASRRIISSLDGRFYNYTKTLFPLLKDNGYKIIFVTDEPDFLAEIVKTRLGADDALGFEIEIKDGKFTDRAKVTPDDATDKAQKVQNVALKHNISLKDSLAIGDSDADVGMLELVGTGILLGRRSSLAKGSGVTFCNREGLMQVLQRLQQ